MNISRLFFILMILSGLFACNSSRSKIDGLIYSEFQKKGNEITGLSQAVLLGKVGKAIQNGGPEYAVEFCNLNVSAIVDSLNQVNNCMISRISAKNRNPGNGLKSDLEKELWQIFETQALKDTLIKTGGKLVYFKPIKTGMPACLNCHGTPGSEINSATLEKINQLYPDDLATNYQLNDFRGLWKVQFNK